MINLDTRASDDPWHCVCGPAAHADALAMLLATETEPGDVLMQCGCIAVLTEPVTVAISPAHWNHELQRGRLPLLIESTIEEAWRSL